GRKTRLHAPAILLICDHVRDSARRERPSVLRVPLPGSGGMHFVDTNLEDLAGDPLGVIPAGARRLLEIDAWDVLIGVARQLECAGAGTYMRKVQRRRPDTWISGVPGFKVPIEREERRLHPQGGGLRAERRLRVHT